MMLALLVFIKAITLPAKLKHKPIKANDFAVIPHTP